MEPGSRTSFSQRFEDYRPTKTVLFWSCVASVIVTIVIGFGWGGWVTGGTADEVAESAAEDARQELVAAVCVDRFMAAGDVRARLVELKDLASSYRQGEFIEDGGWAMIPGTDEASDGGAELCAEQLVTMEPPAAQEASTINEGATVAQ
jgi:hypothetical protein